jgi:hypothetical protein
MCVSSRWLTARLYGKVVKFLSVTLNMAATFPFACRWVPYGATDCRYAPCTEPDRTEPDCIEADQPI